MSKQIQIRIDYVTVEQKSLKINNKKLKKALEIISQHPIYVDPFFQQGRRSSTDRLNECIHAARVALMYER